MSARDPRRWRLLDTGLRRAAENMAFNRALLECHQQGDAPHTLRFLRFSPSALIGFHQDVEQELLVDYCREQGIDIQRRVTGGGAIYFDETQLGWELYLDKSILGTADMTAISARICEAAARGMRTLGVDAQFRPRNDIEVDGRKISGTGGAFDGDSILFQGTLLLEFDVERMLRVLKIPAEKLSDKAIASARERVANLKDLLGELPPFDEVQARLAQAFAEEFEVEFEPGEVSAAERAAFAEALAEFDSDEWVYQHNRPAEGAPLLEAIYRCSGGTLRVALRLDALRNRIKQVWITGDFFITPARMVVDLEAALRDTAVVDLEANVERFFDGYPVEMLMLGRDDFVKAIRTVLDASADDTSAADGA
jgi:lipoate-protein ligase A